MTINFSRISYLGFVAFMVSSLILSSLSIALPTTQSNPLALDVVSFEETRSILSDSQIQLNATDIENFMDEVIPEYMEEKGVAGILISVVKEGDVLMSEGYGYADVDEDIFATSDDTLFGIASISKTFTSTAVMTLVENGTLDLDEDINNYLDSFQIPLLEDSNPITLRHLLTHTAGFEESLDQIFYYIYSEMLTMEAFLRNNMPAQVHPAGYIQSYSNLGLSLAGQIIHDVTGYSFEEYLEMFVLEPLGLDHTTAYQDIPVSISGVYSQGYVSAGEESVELPHFYCVVPPTGGMASTADDMAQFMIMQLNEGYYEGDQFLENQTVLAMQDEQFLGHPDIPGIGYGLYMSLTNNESIVYHTGGMPTFSSKMALIPEHDVGIFISINTDTGDYDDVFDMFMDRYFPASVTLPESVPISSEQLTLFEGYYLPTRREYVGLSDGLISMYGSMVTQIIVLPDDSLCMKTNYWPIDGMRFTHIGDRAFQDQSGLTDTRIAFRVDEQGTYIFSTLAAVSVMEKLDSWYLEVTGPDTVEMNESEFSYEIYWTVDAGDFQANTYSIFCNGVNVSTSYWTPMRGITFDMSGYPGGIYNVTIVVTDILNCIATHTTIVEIIPRPLDTVMLASGGIASVMVVASVVIIIKAKRP